MPDTNNTYIGLHTYVHDIVIVYFCKIFILIIISDADLYFYSLIQAPPYQLKFLGTANFQGGGNIALKTRLEYSLPNTIWNE